jgi:beta-lactam-binding protein with PASTA domain/tRNA A-37 threonylcarbamoyl transferase component Bud32
LEPKILGNRYELIEKIGEGGMSYVYKARCQILDRIVAIKILKEEYSDDQAFVSRFRTEAMAAARLSHPNIVNIYDVGQQDDVYYIVMEYVEGTTLKELIAQEAPLPVGRAIDIAVMICDGIQHAHDKGIIHRDIKPHNILVTTTGMVKVADFGIAQAISKKTITFGGNIVGSVHYISPEQAKGEPVTIATDIYSLGCVLYEMLTGTPPFDAESPVTVALKHIHDEITPPRQINESIPMALEGIIYRAMEKVPEKRFNSAQKMRNDLLNMDGAYAGYKPGYASKETIIMPPVSEEGMDETMKKRKLRTSGIIAIIALLGLFSGMLVMLGGNFFGQEVVVPDIVGMDIKEANNELKTVNLGMKVKEKRFSDEFEKDQIIFQDPGKGQKVKEGRQIEVIQSLGFEKIAVPGVVGKQLSDAEIIIGNEGFEIGDIDKNYDDKYKEGYIISQEPRAGTRVAKNSKIDLMVSKGPTPDKIPMPDLIGLTLEEARKQIEDSKLVLGEVTKKDSSDYYADQVIEQNTKPEVMVDEGTTVDLVVSKGPGPVPHTQVVEYPLPQQSDYYKVVIILHDAQGKKKIYDQLHAGGDTVNLMVNYFGNASLEIQLNGKPYAVYKL